LEVAPRDPHVVELDDGARVHKGCAGKLMRRVALTLPVKAATEIARRLRRHIGEEKYGALFEREVVPALQSVGHDRRAALRHIKPQRRDAQPGVARWPSLRWAKWARQVRPEGAAAN
jgi:hypothetical protein